jgi:hypothetical protein
MSPPDRWQNFDVWAVAKGVGAAIVASVILGFGFGFLAFSVFFTASASFQFDPESIVLLLVVFVIGLTPGLIGGYIAGYNAGYAQIRHGLSTGLVLLVSNAALELFCSEAVSWSSVAYLLLIVPITALGGLIARLRE